MREPFAHSANCKLPTQIYGILSKKQFKGNESKHEKRKKGKYSFSKYCIIRTTTNNIYYQIFEHKYLFLIPSLLPQCRQKENYRILQRKHPLEGNNDTFLVADTLPFSLSLLNHTIKWKKKPD